MKQNSQRDSTRGRVREKKNQSRGSEGLRGEKREGERERGIEREGKSGGVREGERGMGGGQTSS